MNAKEALEMYLKIELDRLKRIERETIECEDRIVDLRKRIKNLES